MAESLPPLPPRPPRPPGPPPDPLAIPPPPNAERDPGAYVSWVLCRAREILEDEGEDVGFMDWLKRDRPDTRGLLRHSMPAVPYRTYLRDEEGSGEHGRRGGRGSRPQTLA